MRKFMLSILLAGVAASPALAQDNGDGRWHHNQQQSDRGQGHQDHQQARSEARPEPQQRFNGGGFGGEQQQRAAPQFQQRQQVQVEERQQVRQWQGRGDGGQRFNRGEAAAQQQVVEQQQRSFDRSRFEGQQREQAQQWQGRNGYAGTYRQREPGQWTQQQRTGQWTQQQGTRQWTQQQGTRQWTRDGARTGGSRYSGNWNRNWRNDNHYDWRRYRNSHRSVFSLGIYYDPFGYNYRPFGIGYRLTPAYFGEQYWIDPAMYDLPFPPPGTQWIRYWNDALLVDMYSGEVVDVINNFFW